MVTSFVLRKAKLADSGECELTGFEWSALFAHTYSIAPLVAKCKFLAFLNLLFSIGYGVLCNTILF